MAACVMPIRRLFSSISKAGLKSVLNKAEFHPHLSFRCGFQVTQTVSKSLSGQAELAMLLLDGGHTLEHHLIILPEERGALKPKMFDSDLSKINTT